MIIQVTGGREWDNIERVREILAPYAGSENTLRHGNCRGLDKQSAQVARELGMQVDTMPAQWRLHAGCRCSLWRRENSYCSYAGPRRNREMLDKEPLPDVVYAFHNAIEASRGTKDCVDAAIERGLRVVLVTDTEVGVLSKGRLTR